jgi:methyltransferase-like protein
MLKACYEGAKAADELYSHRLCQKRDLIMTVETFLIALATFKEKLGNTIKTNTVILGAMESDGEQVAAVYTLPLLKAFGHKVLLVTSFCSEWYIEDILKYDSKLYV